MSYDHDSFIPECKSAFSGSLIPEMFYNTALPVDKTYFHNMPENPGESISGVLGAASYFSDILDVRVYRNTNELVYSTDNVLDTSSKINMNIIFKGTTVADAEMWVGFQIRMGTYDLAKV